MERSFLYVPCSENMRVSAATGAKGVLFVDAGDAGQVLYWELRRLMEPLMVHDPDDPSSGPRSSTPPNQLFHRWWKKKMAKGIQGRFENSGLHLVSVRPSIKQATALKVADEGMKWLHVETIATTQAVLVALCHMASTSKTLYARTVAQKVLHDFLAATLSSDFKVADTLGHDAQVAPLHLCLAYDQGCLDTGKCIHAMRVVVPENVFGLASFLSELFSTSDDDCQVLPGWFAMVLDKIASHVATRASTNTIGNATPEHFPVLRTKHKARGLDTGIAVAGANSVSDKSFRSTSRMAAAGNIPVARQTARSVDESPNTPPIKKYGKLIKVMVQWSNRPTMVESSQRSRRR